MRKVYEKPAIEMIELRSEERLAACKSRLVGPFLILFIIPFFGCYYRPFNGGGNS